MTILITGGTGKTGGKLAQLLHANNHSVLIATRSGVAPEPFKAVKFDWLDEKTFENPFEADSHIDKIYLVAPSVFDCLPIVKPFIDYAISKGVTRFVLCGSSAMDKGDILYGKIHEYLANIGIGYTVLRPTWFMENLGTFYVTSIRDDDEIATVAEDGPVAFVGVDDIAKAAYDALVSQESLNTELFIVGPILYTYDEVAAVLSNTLGRKITHRRISHEESIGFWEGSGLTPEFAAMLTGMEGKIA